MDYTVKFHPHRSKVPALVHGISTEDHLAALVESKFPQARDVRVFVKGQDIKVEFTLPQHENSV